MLIFAYAKSRFSHDAAHIKLDTDRLCGHLRKTSLKHGTPDSDVRVQVLYMYLLYILYHH